METNNQNKHVDSSLETQLKNPDFWSEQAEKYSKMGRYEDALTSYNCLLRISPEHSKAWVFKGGVLTHLNRYEEALMSFEEALKINPNDQAAQLFRGAALQHLGYYQKAYESYDQVLGVQRSWLERKIINLLTRIMGNKQIA